MRAMAIEAFGGPEQLVLLDLPSPAPAAGEVVIRVMAAGVNPIDCKIRQGYMGGVTSHRARPHHFPVVLGWDCAGIIDAIGDGVTSFRPDDEVFAHCVKPAISDGTYAEYVCVPADQVARMPVSIDFVSSAAVPVAGLTAYQAIKQRLVLAPGETILITAAAGGVGSFAVQLAADLGAHIIATASSRNQEFVRELGASEVIDYRNCDVIENVAQAHPQGIDAILHCVASEDVDRSASLLRPGGRLRWIVGGARAHTISRGDVYGDYVGLVEPNAEQLADLARLIDAGRIKIILQEVIPLDQAARAHSLVEGGHVRGKVVLDVRAA